jgi:hypothetical protein
MWEGLAVQGLLIHSPGHLLLTLEAVAVAAVGLLLVLAWVVLEAAVLVVLQHWDQMEH